MVANNLDKLIIIYSSLNKMVLHINRVLSTSPLHQKYLNPVGEVKVVVPKSIRSHLNLKLGRKRGEISLGPELLKDLLNIR